MVTHTPDDLLAAWSAQLDTLDWSGVSQATLLSVIPSSANPASSIAITVPGKPGFSSRILTIFGQNMSLDLFHGFIPSFSGNATKITLSGTDAAPDLNLIPTPLADVAQQLLNDFNDADKAVGAPFITYALSRLDLSGPPIVSDDTPAGARDIGSNPSNNAITDGFTLKEGATSDVFDYYKFTIDGAPRVVDLEVAVNTGIYSIAIYDSLDNAIAFANQIYYDNPFPVSDGLPYKFLRLLGPGTYYLELQAIQQLLWPGSGGPGQINYSLTINSVVDTIAPIPPSLSLKEDTASAPGTFNSDRITKNPTINVTGLEPGARWEYTTDFNAQTKKGTWVTGTGNSFNVAPGAYKAGQVRVRQFDVAGNPSANTSFAAFTVDVSPPATPSLSLAVGADTINVAGLESGATWQYSVSSGKQGTWLTGTGNSFNVAPGAYKTGQVRVRQFDVAGNPSPANTSFAAFTVGAPAPTPPSLALAEDTGASATDRITKNPTINVTGLVANATWEYSTDSGNSWIPGSGSSFELPSWDYLTGQVQVRQSVGAATSAANTSFEGLTVDTSVPWAPGLDLSDTGENTMDRIITNPVITLSFLEASAGWEYSTDSGATWNPGSGSSFNVQPGVYTAGQVQARQIDLAGNTGDSNTFFDAFTVLPADVNAATSFTLADPQINLTLTGSKRINGIGNSLNNTIIGNSANNRIFGLGGKDTLTGGGGANIFGYNALTESIRESFDIITDFNNTDRILAPLSVESELLTASLGSIASTNRAVVAGLLTAQTFMPNSVAAFTVTGQVGTYIAMNDGNAGFQQFADSIIFLRNYSISPANFVDFV
jgi:Ca2+-binding RTX toxin-like protein